MVLRRWLRQRAAAEEATLALADAVGADAELPADIAAALDALGALDDAALQRVSRSRPSVEDGVLLDALTDARRRGQLGPDGERALGGPA